VPRRRAAAAIAAAAGIAAAVALLAGRGDGRARGGVVAGEPAGAARARLPGGRLPAPTPALAARHAPPADGVRDPAWGDDAPVTATTLEAYLITSVYPPQSRPLGRFADDLLHPNRRHEDFVPIGDGELTVRFTADRYVVHGDEPLVATLEVRRGAVPVAVEITEAFAARYRPGEIPAAAARLPVELTWQGGLHVGELSPAALPGLRETTAVGVYVELDHGGADRVRAMFIVHATPAVAIPARFTGDFRDRVEEGSLLVEVGLKVREPGWYLIDCNLFDADDHPVAWTRFKGDLAAGTHWVPLSFFGKVLVDSRSTSPWHLGQLRGARFVEGREPDLDGIPMFEGTYHTARYPLTAFSDAPYDSPAKQDRIRLLEEAQRQGRR
jgi:hypothetical protein